MGAARKPRAAPAAGGDGGIKAPVADVDAGREAPAEPPTAAPDGGAGCDGGTLSGAPPAPPTGAQGAPDGGGDDDGSPKYPADHFFKSNWYSHRRGDLEKLLAADKLYSYAQIERMLPRR